MTIMYEFVFFIFYGLLGFWGRVSSKQKYNSMTSLFVNEIRLLPQIYFSRQFLVILDSTMLADK